MLSSPHKIKLSGNLREVRVRTGAESFVSEVKMRQQLEERFRAGFEAGQKALNEQLMEQRKQLFEIQTGVLTSISNALPNLVAECEKSLVLLALEAAKRVVYQMPVTPELIERTVKSALAELRDTAEYTVLIHPADLAMLREISSDVLPAPLNSKITFTPDESIVRGGCRVQTGLGSIEAAREKMFEKLESAVLC